MTVTVKSGQQFVGILHTCCPDKEVGVVLSMAREKLGPDDNVPKVEEKLVILSKDFVQLVANEVDLYNDEIIEGAVKNQGARPIGRGRGTEGSRHTGDHRPSPLSPRLLSRHPPVAAFAIMARGLRAPRAMPSPPNVLAECPRRMPAARSTALSLPRARVQERSSLMARLRSQAAAPARSASWKWRGRG